MKKIISSLLSLCLTFSLSVPAFASEKTLQKVNQYTPGQFTDVPDTLWCASNVQSVYEYGLMNGVSDSYFSVNGELTVIQSIVMGLPHPTPTITAMPSTPPMQASGISPMWITRKHTSWYGRRTVPTTAPLAEKPL